MRKSFDSIEALLKYMETADKQPIGDEAGMRDRYPVRFILFENFADFHEFIIKHPANTFHSAIDQLIDSEKPDFFPTYSEVGTHIEDLIRNNKSYADYIISPFSEMCRFYKKEELSALVKTIKSLEPCREAQEKHVRIYIPIVGMEQKMADFEKDPHAFVWVYKPAAASSVYNLILTNGSTYGVSGLDKTYTLAGNLKEWLTLWKKGGEVRNNIICSSANIFANSDYARPDNAFSHVKCHNAYEFLTKGLNLDFGNDAFRSSEEPMWEKLASMIDVADFDFQDFVNERFGTHEIDDSSDFIRAWLDVKSDFDFNRWLLSVYYKKLQGGEGYICELLKRCESLNDNELFSAIATGVFDGLDSEEYVKKRRLALQTAAENGITIKKSSEDDIYDHMSALLKGTDEDRQAAKLYMTDFTDSDRRIVIEAYASGILTYPELKDIYPGLYFYLSEMHIQLPPDQSWVPAYFKKYREAKVRNDIEIVQPMLRELNANQIAFEKWHGEFKTVKTLLHNRQDIDKFYWVDGLGLDWVPFITQIVMNLNHENVYLNEVLVASALLPTTTEVNKRKLEELLPDGEKLEKIGSIDEFAHQTKNPHPLYIIEEIRRVGNIIADVLKKYNGQKIAFISDHGISYMAQYGKGLNLACVEENHEGRVAYKENGAPIADEQYIILEDGKTMCALSENSLSSKTPATHGAHGGATPEEVLVPIFIVSSQENPSSYSAELVSNEIKGTDPVARIKIKGLQSVDNPLIEYNNATYALMQDSGDVFVSEKLNLVDTAADITLRIGNYSKTFKVKLNTGAEEDDIFGGML